MGRKEEIGEIIFLHFRAQIYVKETGAATPLLNYKGYTRKEIQILYFSCQWFSLQSKTRLYTAGGSGGGKSFLCTEFLNPQKSWLYMQHKENVDVHRAERGRQNNTGINPVQCFIWVKFRDKRLQPAGHTRAKSATHSQESPDVV